jgi:hypothetical protein
MSQAAKKLNVDRYLPGDEFDILALNLAEYGPNHVMVTPEAFHWRYAENPSGQAEITVVRDEETEHVVAFTWTIPLRMRLFGQDYLAVMTANQLVHPDYRDSLAYAKLLRHRLQRIRQEGIPFRFNFPIESLFDRTGSIEKMASFLIPLLVRPLDPVKLAQTRFAQAWVGSLLGWGGQAVTPLLFHPQSFKTQETPPIRVNWIDRFDERFDELWVRVQDKCAIMTVRNQAFLTWRFPSVAGRAYRILAASVEDKLIGYMVVRCTDEIRSIPTGLIMDFLLEPGTRGEEAGILLLAEAWRYFQAEKVWLAGGLAFPHTAEFQVMRRAGYRSLPQRWMPRLFRLAFNCFGDDLPDTTQIKTEDWFITIADYEAH